MTNIGAPTILRGRSTYAHTKEIQEVKDMRYLKEDDNRYRVRFMPATEKLMDALTVSQFIEYLEENAELESDEEYEYIGGKVVKCKAYDLKEAESNLHKEFLVTEDGRLFYWLSLNSKIELVDREDQEERTETRVIQDANGYWVAEIRFLPVAPWEPNDGWRGCYTSAIKEHAEDYFKKGEVA